MFLDTNNMGLGHVENFLVPSKLKIVIRNSTFFEEFLVVLFQLLGKFFWGIPEFHIRPYCHIWDCTRGLDSRMNVIESAFESSDTILVDHKKFSHIRTHPEELRAVKSKKCCYIHIISGKIYFSRRVVLRDEFLCYWFFFDRKVWCLSSSQTHFQPRSFGYPNHLYDLIYANKALCGILVYLKFSPT